MNTLYFFAGFFTACVVIYLYAKYAASRIVRDEHMSVHQDILNEWRLSREVAERNADTWKDIRDALLSEKPDSASKQPQGVEIR